VSIILAELNRAGGKALYSETNKLIAVILFGLRKAWYSNGRTIKADQYLSRNIGLYLRFRNPKLATVGIRCPDHATPSIP
jgi:hypothetical protein